MTGTVEHVVHPDDVEPTRSDGVDVRVTFDARNGCERLEQRILRFDRGASHERRTDANQELLYVASGRGTITVDGDEYPLDADTGVYLAPGTTFVLDAADELVVIAVTTPYQRAGERPPTVVRFADQQELEASPERSFRYLVDEGDLTQFIGIVQPSKAPFHSHPYDEVGYVVEGTGIAHVDGQELPLRAGSCFHLSPNQVHCIENTGPGAMRIMGVFHPSDSPASRNYPDNN
jgi:quercetin dioxygenase-like cupin family protein